MTPGPDPFACRPGCGACCIAPSINRPIPGMPNGKPAGVRCVNLDPDNRCTLWGTDRYPDTCRGFQPEHDICGDSTDQALARLTILERVTSPGAP